MKNHRHFLRYGSHADQRYFMRDMQKTFDSVIFAANLIAHSPSGIAGFLAHTLQEKGYIIDPQTYMFQMDPVAVLSANKDGKLTRKSSIEKLINEYGEPVLSIAGKSPLQINNLDEKKVKESFCKQVINFQERFLLQDAQEQDFWDMLKFAAQADGGDAESFFQPLAVIAPFFYMAGLNYEDWLSLNVEMFDIASDYADTDRIWGGLICDRDLIMDDDAIEEIAKRYASAEMEECVLWINDFNEHEESISTLRSLRKLAKCFADRDIELLNLYGGYFSIALAKIGEFGAVCHGPEWGESRAIAPVGGGVPVSKFYHHRLHERLPFAQALSLATTSGGLSSKNKYHKMVCSCPQCQSIINNPNSDFREYGEFNETRFVRNGQLVSMTYPTPETKENCTRHYLWNKKAEFEKYGQNLQEIVEELGKDIQWVSKQKSEMTAGHLIRWRDAFGDS